MLDSFGGYTYEALANEFNVRVNTNKRLRRRYNDTADIKDKPCTCSGRLVTTRRQDQFIETKATRARFVTVNEVENYTRTTMQPDTTLLQL
jgi:transposase